MSGNPTGPVTVATARNAAYGDSLARLFEFAGHDVGREYYFNDAGRQVDLFGESLKARAAGAEPPEDGYQGAYVAEVAAELGLGPDADVRRLGAGRHRRDDRPDPDDPRALPVLVRLLVPGAVAVRERGGAARDRPRPGRGARLRATTGRCGCARPPWATTRTACSSARDGSFTYVAGDLAYVADKLERGFDTAVYVLGADHHGYIGRLKAAAQTLGYDPARVDVQIYQLVRLRRGQDVEAGRADRDARRPARRDRRRRGPLRARAARARPADRARPRPAHRPERREPRLLLPVRPRPDRRDPAPGRRRRRGRARPGVDARAGRGASWSRRWPSSPDWSPRPPSGAARTGSPATPRTRRRPSTSSTSSAR